MSARQAILISTAVGYLIGGLVVLFWWPHWVTALSGDEFEGMGAGARIMTIGLIMLPITWAIGVFASEKIGGDQPAGWRHIAIGAVIGFGFLAVAALVITIDVLDD